MKVVFEESNCSLCSLKPYIWHGEWQREESSLKLATGPWTGLYACRCEDGRLALYGLGDSYTDMYYPAYCPECGRRIAENDSKTGNMVYWITDEDDPFEYATCPNCQMMIQNRLKSRRDSIIYRASFCDNCGIRLSWEDIQE